MLMKQNSKKVKYEWISTFHIILGRASARVGD